ncbi:MAG TPA: hypothetical protein VME18_09995 [Acidobacteriaceae bacterium]|nr:hypothetical protein [Acidobacteriaceae bacterium]
MCAGGIEALIDRLPRFVTASVIHIPAGQPVTLEVESLVFRNEKF